MSQSYFIRYSNNKSTVITKTNSFSSNESFLNFAVYQNVVRHKGQFDSCLFGRGSVCRLAKRQKNAYKLEMPNSKRRRAVCRQKQGVQCFAHLTAKTSNVVGKMSTKQQKFLRTIQFVKPYLVPNLLVSAVNFVIFKPPSPQ